MLVHRITFAATAGKNRVETKMAEITPATIETPSR